MVKRICLHGPESTGKSTLAARLAAHLHCEIVPEYGRAYCEGHGTDIGMAELAHIAETQDAMNRAAAERARVLGARHVLFDTDPLITAVWAEMMFGKRDIWFAAFTGYADLYLLLDIDLPFVDDGLRVYAGTKERQHFFDLCKAELDARGVAYALVRGQGDARFHAALTAIQTALAT
jgi:NadR type nicotinamide-nucleotide adenylyltransferase